MTTRKHLILALGTGCPSMKSVAVLACLLCVSICVWGLVSSAGNGRPNRQVVVDLSEERTCSEEQLYFHHDSSFEWAYAWWWDCGLQPPYYGSFAEAFDLGPGRIHCGAYWATSVGYMPGGLVDVYVWEGGISEAPGTVLALVAGVHLWCPYWPAVGQTDVEIGIDVVGEFSIGCWQRVYEDLYFAADHDEPGGKPWTCIAPGMEWPSGWQDPAIVWEDIRSMGMGVFFEPRDPSGVDDFPEGWEEPGSSWGRIKALFRQ